MTLPGLRYVVKTIESGHVEMLQWTPTCGEPLYGIRVTALGGVRVEFHCGSQQRARELAAAHCACSIGWDDWPDIVGPVDVPWETEDEMLARLEPEYVRTGNTLPDIMVECPYCGLIHRHERPIPENYILDASCGNGTYRVAPRTIEPPATSPQ